MNDEAKRKQLRKYKAFATGLFLLMAVIFIATSLLQKNIDSHWIGYVRAFSEAAMVGALADWFAVTALFRHPLGLPIPHTNLIENSKQRLGDNLGSFVVSNFLSPQNIRPYIQKLKISGFVGEWLGKEKNQGILIKNLSDIVLDILNKLDDSIVSHFITKKVQEMTDDIKLNKIVGNGISYIIEKNDHQRMVTNLSSQIKNYIIENDEMIKERVKKGSYTFIPSFVDNKIADKIAVGLSDFFKEIEEDPQHEIRTLITQKIHEFSVDLKEDPKWDEEFTNIKNDLLKGNKLEEYSNDIWISIKNTLKNELQEEQSTLKMYLSRNLNEFSENLKTDENLQNKIDEWVRVTAYKYILKNTHQFGNLISSTVGNWQGKELSEKLELEVGKDLQFIRVNGTLVGGLVGLIIYTISHFFL
jgi:Predicted membrane protein